MFNSLSTIKHLALITALAIFSHSTPAADYIFRDLMGNTLPPQKCDEKSTASLRATEKYNIDKYMKRFCETQGYGWYVSEQKSDGKLICNECTTDSDKGKFKCHVEDITVSCKRIKPGSVGLFPGKG